MKRALTERTLTSSGREAQVGPQMPLQVEAFLAGQSEDFFLGLDGKPLPIWGEPDPDFDRFGLRRSQVTLRGLTAPLPVDAPACLLLRLRTLFGLSPRAEAAAYLLARGTASAGEVARATRFSAPAAREALTELALGGFAQGPVRGTFALDQDRWRAFLGLSEWPQWVDWARALPALADAVAIANTMALADAEGESEYLWASALRRLDLYLGEELAGSGLPNPFLVLVRLEDAAQTVGERLQALTDGLNTENK